MAKRDRLSFGTWIPTDGREELAKQSDLPGADYPLLKRLASRGMKPAVWDRLPPASRGREGCIIAWTCGAADISAKWQPKAPIGNPPAQSAIIHAEFLASAMRASIPDAFDRWHALWQGDSGITFEIAVSVVDQLTDFYRRLDAENKQLWAAVNFPHPHKKRGKNVRFAMVSRLLSDRFQKNFGEPCDEAVAELVAVVFNYPKEGVSAEAVRGWRRFRPTG